MSDEPTLDTPEQRALRRRAFVEGSVTVHDLVKNAKSPEWRVDRLVPKVGVIVVAGLAKHARKTITMMHLLKCISRGEPFLGHFACMKGVAYMANIEDGASRLAWRAKCLGMGKDKDESVLFMRDRGVLSTFLHVLDDPLTGFDVAVIDPLAECALLRGLKNENDPLEMIASITPFREAALVAERNFILIHHFRKAGDMARGSSALQGAVDGWWDIYPVDGEPELTHVEVTLRDGPPHEFGIRTVFNEDNSITHEYVDPSETKDRKAEPGKRRGRRSVTDDQLRAEIAVALKENGPTAKHPLADAVGHKAQRVRSLIEQMAEAGDLWFDPVSGLYTLPNPTHGTPIGQFLADHAPDK